MNYFEQFIIISAEKLLPSDDRTLSGNRVRDEDLKRWLVSNNIKYKEAMSVNNITKKDDRILYVCKVNSQKDIDTLLYKAVSGYDQIGVIHQDSNGYCHFLKPEGKSFRLGKLRKELPQRIDTLNKYILCSKEAYSIVRG